MFRLVSQIRIHYADSPLSEKKAGEVHGGDRLPWLPTGSNHNFVPLRSLGWQLQVYGEATRDLKSFCQAEGLTLHVFAWDDAAGHAGFKRDAAYLVRPDGHVALAMPEQSTAGLEAFIRRHGLEFKEGRAN